MNKIKIPEETKKKLIEEMKRRGLSKMILIIKDGKGRTIDIIEIYRTPPKTIFICEVCGKKFKSWTACMRHLRVEHLIPYPTSREYIKHEVVEYYQ